MILKELGAKNILNFTLFPRFLSLVGDGEGEGMKAKHMKKKLTFAFPPKVL